MKILIAVVGAALLVSCQTKQIDELSYSERKELAAQIAKRCADQGYPDGHKEQESCIRQEISKEYADRQNARLRRANAASILSQTGANMQRNAAMNRPWNCTSSPGYGGVVRTNCY